MFWVLGGYIATTGVLVVYIAGTGVRAGNAGVLAVVAVAAVTSIGWMATANFRIRSDFRWVLLSAGEQPRGVQPGRIGQMSQHLRGQPQLITGSGQLRR